MRIVKPAQANTKLIPGNSQRAHLLSRKLIAVQDHSIV
jgi:hypothetical protein